MDFCEFGKQMGGRLSNSVNEFPVFRHGIDIGLSLHELRRGCHSTTPT
jgi:hypothetical protein